MSTGASSIILPSYSSAAGSKIQIGMVCQSELGLCASVGSGHLDTEKTVIRCPHTVPPSQPPQDCRSHFVWPSREQQQQLLQAQLAAAVVQQETQQRLQKARAVLVRAARPGTFLLSQPVMSPHLSSPRASYTAATKVATTPLSAPIAALAAALVAPWFLTLEHVVCVTIPT